MSAPTHTPGPWSYDADECEVHADTVHQRDGDPAHICELLGPEFRKAANGQLIAAAPEMLEALRNCLAYFLQRDSKLFGASRTTSEFAAMLDGVIAKAEGLA